MAFNSPDQTADLWLKIDQLHLNYLKSEDNTNKIEIRKKLEGFIHQYLCLVPQDRKFCNPLATVILFESARWVTDFSALKAARAFEAIEKYAANLINQPWRKEFKEIKQYGGFYKHQVESFLNAPERLFHLMGYVSTGQQSLVLDGQVDLDKVTVVARDCVLAYVECQIVVSILQGVTAQFPCRWEEVLEFRRNHIGSPEQATRALIYQKNQMQYGPHQGYQPPHGQHPPPPQGSYHFGQTPQIHPGQPQQFPGAVPPGYHPPYSMPSYPNHQQQSYPPHPGGHGHPMAAHPQQQQHPPQVPTANLIDVNSPGSNSLAAVGMMNGHNNTSNVNKKLNAIKHNNHDEPLGGSSSASSTSTLTGQRGPIPLTIKQLEAESRRKTLLAEAAAAAASANEAKNPLESWDYVYRQLESIGYTKDQGERPDVLDLLSKVGMPVQHRIQLEQRLREEQLLHQGQGGQQLQHGLPQLQQVQDPNRYPHQQHEPEQGPAPPRRPPSKRDNYQDQKMPNTSRQERPKSQRDFTDFARPSSSSGLQGQLRPHSSASYQKPAPRGQPQYQQHRQYESQEDSGNDEVGVNVHEEVELPPVLPQKGRNMPPKLPEKKRAYQHHQHHQQQQQHYQPEDYGDYCRDGESPEVEEYDDDEDEVDGDEDGETWQCHACTYLNSLEYDICEMCSKSRRSVASHSRDDEDEFVSGNSQMDDYPEAGGQEDHGQDEVQCPKCTLYNPNYRKVCDACGASLHIAPIKNNTGGSKKRPQSSASSASGGGGRLSRGHHR